MEGAVSSFFKKQGKNDPTKNFGWDYILVDNDAHCPEILAHASEQKRQKKELNEVYL